mmetsp:Transcript_68924/g.217921  ORF Transcript_68924/g.217921 Transcript_68924/m.217921 type:complete len:387 (-) Transcript_68924:67-1227(-)
MTTYAQRHAPPERTSRSPSPCPGTRSPAAENLSSGRDCAAGGPLTRGAEKLLAEGFGACVERLEAKAKALEGQVAQALRNVGLLHDMVGALDARMAVLEIRVPVSMDSARQQGCSRSEPQRGVDERLQQRFTELREWQADVEDAVRQLSAEARRGTSSSSRGVPVDGPALGGAAEGDFTLQDSLWFGSDVGEQRLQELTHSTETRLGQLEDHLLALRRQLTSSAAPAARIEAAAPSVPAREPPQQEPAWPPEGGGPLSRSGSAPALRVERGSGGGGSSGSASGAGAAAAVDERPVQRRLWSARDRSAVGRLFDELLRLEGKSKADGTDRSLATSAASHCAAARGAPHGRNSAGVGTAGAAVRSMSAVGRRSSAGMGGPGPVRARRR